MKQITKLLLAIITAFVALIPNIATAQDTPKINTNIETRGETPLKQLQEFGENKEYGKYFIRGDGSDGWAQIKNTFEAIAYGIKNFVILLAVIFLIVGVIKLLFSDASDAEVKKWKNNLFWTAIGIFFMQISYSIWRTGILSEQDIEWKNPINAVFSWNFWHNIVEPIIALIQFFASFAFLAMMFYAFYIIVTGGWDEEKLNSWKKTLAYGLIGFLMIQVPNSLVSMIYSGVPRCSEWSSLWSYASQNCTKWPDTDLGKTIEFTAEFFKYFNGFLTLLCVLMAIYAGWLLLISKWDEDKRKKAKNIIVYIAIGLVLLVASHAIFRFFLMQ